MLWAVIVLAFSVFSGAIIFAIVTRQNTTISEVLTSPSMQGMEVIYFYLAFASIALILIQYLLLGNFDPRRLINPK